MLEQSLRKLFEQQAEAEPPPGRITVAYVLRQGRLRRRWHRIGAVGAPILAAVAVAAIALPSGIVGQSSPSAVGHGRVAGGAFDPSYLAIRLGWLPKGAVVTGGQVTPGGEALSVAAPHGWIWAVGVYARNLCHVTTTARRFDCLGIVNAPTLGVGATPQGTTTVPISGRGPAIDGHRSLWLLGTGSILAWQYAPGAWTVVQSSSGLAATVRIARAVEYGQHVPVHFAARFTSLPRGWGISGILFARVDGVYLASTYRIVKVRTIRPTRPVFTGASDEPTISISPAKVSASRCRFNPGISRRQVRIHGYRFTVQDEDLQDGVFSSLCGNHVDGLEVSVGETGARGSISFPPTAVMERLKVLGPEPSDWVTNPLP
jgi:hypothetical protein